MSKPDSYDFRTKKPDSSTSKKVAAPEALNSVLGAAQLSFIPTDVFEVADITGLLQLASAAGVGIMFGFNRTGGLNAMVFIGGEKTKAFIESSDQLARWVTAAQEYIASSFAVERPKAHKQYVDTTKALMEALDAS